MKREVTSAESIFLQLLQLALGTRERMERVPTDEEWAQLYQLAVKHCLVGVCLPALDGCPLEQKLVWIGRTEQMAQQNERLNAQCLQLCNKLTKSGYWNCVLKGQGLALRYPHPKWRQTGDIDIWVEGERDSLVEMVRRVTGQRGEVMYHHVDFPVFPDTEVELHFTPSWMFSPWHNSRLQRWFREQRAAGCVESPLGFPVATDEFNVVFVLVHIFRHVFDEGIGMRQIVDYFFVLKNMQGRTDRLPSLLKYLGLYRFSRAMMWVMGEALGMSEQWMVVKPCERTGRWLLAEILQAGNFGHYDERNKDIINTTRGRRFFLRIRVTLRRLMVFPTEALCEMPWRIVHYIWRRQKGYL